MKNMKVVFVPRNIRNVKVVFVPRNMKVVFVPTSG